MVLVPTHRRPTHPGEILREEFLDPMRITQRELADGIGVPYQRVNELVNGKRGITPSTALRLAEFLGTSVGLWMNLQIRLDLHAAMEDEKEILQQIRKRRVPRTRARKGVAP